MKTILCFGDSNLRGFIPGSFKENTDATERYLKDKRWPGVLQNILGKDYDVIEEGINGRTTVFEEINPGRPFRNGLALLPACLETHFPIDLVIFWLGTNDVKIQYNSSPKAIAEGMRQLVQLVKSCDKGPGLTAPKVLVITPPPITEIALLRPLYDAESIEKSKALASYYQQMANETGCAFLDAGRIVTVSHLDGIHVDAADSLKLATAIADKIKQLIA